MPVEPAKPVVQTDPHASYAALRPEIDAAVAHALASGRYILGPETAAFEAEFAAYLGAGHAIGVASGTDALVLCLRALGVGAGDGVITVSHTAVATVAAIELTGARPILVDIDPLSFTISSDAVEAALARPPAPVKAIVAVHLYGHPAPMDRLRAIADAHGLALIEDACQAHGARFAGKRVGVLGDMAAFSFYPTKNLGAFGDGGAVSTSSAELAERVRSLRQYGWRDRYVSDEPGLNSRLDELQAAVLRVKLPHLDDWNAARRAAAARYTAGLAGLGLAPPQACGPIEHVYQQYVIRSSERDALARRLAEGGVQTAVHYPRPVHLQPAYAGRLAQGPGGLPNTEAVAGEILSLPMHPHLAPDQADRVIAAIGSALRA